MKEKRLYLQTESEDFKDETFGTQVEKQIRFSQDPRDMGYVKENIPCQAACPVYTNIPGYIRCIYENRNGRSYELNRMYNIIPAVLGRICSRPCEAACRHGESDLGEPVHICHLKRAAADHKSTGHRIREQLYARSGKTVAIVGSGPAGLGAAHELATLGHEVTIYEAMDRPGGMLMYGIPAFRLPRDIIEFEVGNILRLGVDVKYGVRVGEDLELSALLGSYDAVLLATGCLTPNMLGIPGEDLEGVYSGLDFMMRVNEGEMIDVGESVAVIGDGFTAMDCSRTCKRLGASSVTVNIRMTEEFMPIDKHELFETKYEKIRINSLLNSTRIIGGSGKVEAIAFERTRLEYDNNPLGRKAVPVENSEFVAPVDTVISAIGQHPHSDFNNVKFRLDGNRIWTRKNSFRTNIDGLYAGGDCMSGASTVIESIGRGRRAAQEIDTAFSGRKRKTTLVRFEPTKQTDRDRSFDFIPPVDMPTVDREARFGNYRKEVEQGYDNEKALEEAKRCYLCYLKYEIDVDRCIYCFACIDVAPRDCIKMIRDVDREKDGSYGDYDATRDWSQVAAIAIDNKRCIRCGKCYDVCPMQCIHISKVELIEQDLEN